MGDGWRYWSAELDRGGMDAQRTEDAGRCYDVCMQEEAGLGESLQTATKTRLGRTLRFEVRMLGLEMELVLARDLAGRIA